MRNFFPTGQALIGLITLIAASLSMLAYAE